MSLPTLLKSGSIKKASWMSEAEIKRLDSIRAIDWIIEYLNDRFWYSADQKPNIVPKTIGDRVGVFRSGTGTGKSTVFPPAIYNKFFEINKKNVICTQPTVVTTVEIPQQIVLYNGNLKLGKNIGYQTKSLVLKPIRGILFSTIGVLLQHLKTLNDEDFAKKYSFIILDEIHNRSIETDTTLYYLKQFLIRNYESPECPYIILTSGTFDPEPLMKYFECKPESFLDIEGSSFPIEDNFIEYPLIDLITYIVDLIEQIHINNLKDGEFRDIMVFLHSSSAITALYDKILELNTNVLSKGDEFTRQHSNSNFQKYGKTGSGSKHYLCPIVLMSESISLGSKDYQNLFSPIDSVQIEVNSKKETPFRRVILATNAAETGLTIDTLKYCIDSGLVQEMIYNPNYSVDVLITKSVTQANSRQRRGRVGRKAPGVFYGCYSKEVYNLMNSLPLADLSKADISQFILDTIISNTQMQLIIDKPSIATTGYEERSLKVDNHRLYSYKNRFDSIVRSLVIENKFKLEIDIFEQPAAEAYIDALEKLRVLGFINDDLNPTMFAYCSTKFRMLNIENIRTILAAYQYNVPICMIVTIVAFIDARLYKKNKYQPRNPLKLSDEALVNWYENILRDELIEGLLIYEDYANAIASNNIDGGDELYKDDAFTTAMKKEKISIKKQANIEDYAEANGFSLEALLKAIDFRSEILSDMTSGEFVIGPYVSLSEMLLTDPKSAYELISNIKRCIYEGYRRNVFVYDERVNSWVSSTRGIALTLDKNPLIKNKPKYIISPSVTFQTEFRGDKISVLDGMVDVDLNFCN